MPSITSQGTGGTVEVQELQIRQEEDPEIFKDPNEAALAFYSMLLFMVFAQLVLVVWRQRHRKSYELVTLLGLWGIPGLISVVSFYWRFFLVWGFFTVTAVLLLRMTLRKVLKPTTPRLVFGFFLTCHRLSSFCTALGTASFLLCVLGMDIPLHAIGRALPWPLSIPFLDIINSRTAVLLCWYGVYFGVLTRDCAAVCSDNIASRSIAGRITSTANRCGICGNALHDSPLAGIPGYEEKTRPSERSIQLTCKHTFHEFCIRGWTLVGKKQTCPCCYEIVDMRELLASKPWETTNLMWIQVLEVVRYLLVWNPAIFLGMHAVFSLETALGLLHPDLAAAAHDNALQAKQSAAERQQQLIQVSKGVGIPPPPMSFLKAA